MERPRNIDRDDDQGQGAIDPRPLGYADVLRLGKKIAALGPSSKITVLCPFCGNAEPCLTISLNRRGQPDVDCPNCGKDKVIIGLARKGLWRGRKPEAAKPLLSEAELDIERWGNQFVKHRRALLESDAWRDLDRRDRHTDRIMIRRLELEHLRHGGRDNGRLQVSKTQFQAMGARRADIPAAKRRLEEHGLIRVDRGGRRSPDLYHLTYMPVGNDAPEDRWRLWKAGQEQRPPVVERKLFQLKRQQIGSDVGPSPEGPWADPSYRAPSSCLEEYRAKSNRAGGGEGYADQASNHKPISVIGELRRWSRELPLSPEASEALVGGGYMEVGVDKYGQRTEKLTAKGERLLRRGGG
jgi:hypothetical protein